MGAIVKHDFKKAFILDEERIRKINDILNRRLEKIEGCPKPVYKIYRSDAFSYTTNNIQDIINEDNSESNSITKLLVLVKHNNKLNFELNFDESGTEINIEGEDRDFIFLLFSDLKDYLSNEVNIYKYIKFSSATLRILFSFLMMFFVILFSVYLSSKSYSQENINAILDSKDIHKKLDFLIQDRTSSYPLILYIGFGIMSIFFIVTIFENNIKKMINYFIPHNIFLFVKAINKYNKRIALRNKLLWGVCIAFIVSIVSSLIVWYITKIQR